ncbi:hypothetical protein SAMN00790413_05977 [Deinococcus hopiensis KR-140]|uniref:Uncharacterized protein n=1 Tax=Deinococcus hopiensis KR-140 TaxID=695939 RepID=A0A1W1VWI2_9DEIO|nr:hypothetical protein SAMN00790413_05977 [Deinococcus hopiensis KR-140]
MIKSVTTTTPTARSGIHKAPLWPSRQRNFRKERFIKGV